MIYPVGNGTKEDFEKNWYVADYFGSDRGTYLHNGYDINLKTGGNTDLGFPLNAISGGKLAYYHYGSHPSKGYGRHNVIRIEGPWGVRWVHYAHNHSDGFLGDVKEVSSGEMVAKIGNSGTDWAHCHFAIFKVDPKTLRNGIDTVAKNVTELNNWWCDPLDFIEEWLNYEEDKEDEFYTAGIKLIEDYRFTRVQGPEGNFEGYSNALIASDRNILVKETDIIGKDEEIAKLNQDITNMKIAFKADVASAKVTAFKEATVAEYVEGIINKLFKKGGGK